MNKYQKGMVKCFGIPCGIFIGVPSCLLLIMTKGSGFLVLSTVLAAMLIPLFLVGYILSSIFGKKSEESIGWSFGLAGISLFFGISGLIIFGWISGALPFGWGELKQNLLVYVTFGILGFGPAAIGAILFGGHCQRSGSIEQIAQPVPPGHPTIDF